jgi:hypothetical protein
MIVHVVVGLLVEPLQPKVHVFASEEDAQKKADALKARFGRKLVGLKVLPREVLTVYPPIGDPDSE